MVFAIRPTDHVGGVHGYRLAKINAEIAPRGLEVRRRNRDPAFALFLNETQLIPWSSLKHAIRKAKDW